MSEQPDIQIIVTTRYVKEQSNPDGGHYAFAYTVEICNRSDETVKLLYRYWHITDDNEKVDEIQGPGVMGKTPEILPGQSYQYSSGTVIETQVGSMHGNYVMQRASGERFTALIAPFLLAHPYAVN